MPQSLGKILLHLVFGTKNRARFLPEEPFTGTLATLLPRVKELPAYVESSKSRMYRLIYREGINELRSEIGCSEVPPLTMIRAFFPCPRTVTMAGPLAESSL